MKAKGLIDDLELQPNYAIIINNQKICSYRADFRYKVIDELGKTMRICGLSLRRCRRL